MTSSFAAYAVLAILVIGHFVLKGLYVRMHRLGRPALSDFGHMVLPEEIRANGHRVPPKMSRFLFPDPIDLPVGFHWVLSFVPKNMLHRYQAFVPIVTESVYIWMVLAFTIMVTARAAPDHVWEGVATVGLILLLSPITWNQNSTNRAHFMLSPRMMGQVLTTAAGLAIVWGYANDSVPAYVLAAFFCSGVLVTSKFGAQAVVFGLPLMALFLFSPMPLAVLALGFIGALIVTGGRYAREFKAHIQWSAYYFTRLRHQSYATTGLRRFSLTHLVVVLRLRGSVGILLRDPFLKPLFLFPVPLAALAIMPDLWTLWTTEPLLRGLTAMYLASVVVWLATLPSLINFLGEPDRYLEFLGNGAVVIVVVVTMLAVEPSRAGLLLIAFLTYVLILYIMGILTPQVTREAKGVQEAARWLQSIPESRILTVPADGAWSFLYYAGRHYWVCYSPNGTVATREELYDRGHFTDERIGPLIGKFNVDYLIRFNVDPPLSEYKYNFSAHPIVFQNEEVTVYAVGGGRK